MEWPLLRHAHVSNATCNRNVFIACPEPQAMAGATTANHMKLIVAIDHRQSTMTSKQQTQLEQGSADKQGGTCLEVADTNKQHCGTQKTTMMYLLAWDRNPTQGYPFF